MPQQQRPQSTSKIDKMVQQVKDVLPQVPISVIRKDICMLSIEDLIEIRNPYIYLMFKKFVDILVIVTHKFEFLRADSDTMSFFILVNNVGKGCRAYNKAPTKEKLREWGSLRREGDKIKLVDVRFKR